MPRISIILIGVLALSLGACKQANEQQMTPYEDKPYEPLSSMDTGSGGGSYAADPYASDPYVDSGTTSDPYATDPIVTPTAQPREEVVVAQTPAVPAQRIHKVVKGDTLYALARQYYGQQGKWRAIWDANRGRISNPDRLYVGTELVIP